MWPFKRKYKIEECGLMEGITDYHSHVLPGVDDGIDKIENSIHVLETYDNLGVDTLWLTPHIMEDVPNTTDDLRARFKYLKENYNGKVKIKLASENMLDNLFEKRLHDNDFLPLGDKGEHLLVETSYFIPPNDFDDKIKRIFAAGYFPMLAHPERYVYMDDADYKRLHDQGVKMQLNLYSLFDFYGKVAKDKALHLLDKGYYFIAGSDTHRYAQVQNALANARLSKDVIEKIKSLPGIE